MENFWDFRVWGSFDLMAVLLLSLLLATVLKKNIKFLRESLIPTPVLGGLMLLIVNIIYKAITGSSVFDTAFFGGNGTALLEIITYHALALGFIAIALKPKAEKLTKERSKEIFDTGVTTVATYLLQAVVGLGITVIASYIMTDLFAAAGVLLPFGFGQGTGQALNYGSIYESEYGFVGGKSFGLTVAAMGFLSASIGGVIHLNILKRKGLLSKHEPRPVRTEDNEVDDSQAKGGIERLTMQVVLIALAYILTHLLMFGLGKLLPGMRSVVYGFNFLIGVLMATLVKLVINFLTKRSVIKKKPVDNRLMDRISNFCFDVMIVSGIAAINLSLIGDYWHILLIMGVVGLLVTYFYNRFVARRAFGGYCEEQFLTMYGMLTGTASTGIMLLREVDPDFCSPASENLVYQNFPAIIFGFPLMLLATLAPKQPLLTLGILVVFFAVMNLILFRSFIFRKRTKKEKAE